MDYPWAAFGSGFGKLIKLIMQRRHTVSCLSLSPPPPPLILRLRTVFKIVCKWKGCGWAASGRLAELSEQDVVSLSCLSSLLGYLPRGRGSPSTPRSGCGVGFEQGCVRGELGTQGEHRL